MRIGTVLSTTGDRALLATRARGFCSDCTERRSCSLAGEGGQEPEQRLSAVNPAGARTGDMVEFELPAGAEVRISILLWLVPIAGLMAGAVAARGFLGGDGWTLAGAMVGLLAGLAPAALSERRHAGRPQAVIVRVVADCEKEAEKQGSFRPA